MTLSRFISNSAVWAFLNDFLMLPNLFLRKLAMLAFDLTVSGLCFLTIPE